MDRPALKIGFAGTPEFAASHLNALIQAGYLPAAVYTQPDRPAGRGKQDQPSPVKTLALANGLLVFQPLSLKSEQAQEQMAALNLDLLIVVAYGLLLPEAVLKLPRLGCINVHASLLPRWRGAAPIERAILAGDKESGVCIMQMDAGLDTGDILLCLKTAISDEDTSATLSQRLSILGQQALLDVLPQIQASTVRPQAQNDEQSSYAKKLNKEDSILNWKQSAQQVLRQINALYPRSPAYSFYQQQRIRIIHASVINVSKKEAPGTIIRADKQGVLVSCEEGSLLLQKVQLPGKAETDIASFLNGRPDFFMPQTCFKPEQE
jgi:methionyl-tRNA formyltransferase